MATAPPPSDIERELLDLKQGEHLCLIYDDRPQEQLPAILPFLRAGLERNDQCIFVTDDLDPDELRAAMTEHGIDVAGATERGALLVWSHADWRQPGPLESKLKSEQVRGIIAGALADGFAGVSIAVEMTWALAPHVDAERLRHWEATLNEVCTPDTPARIVCQYSRRRLPPEAIEAGLATHPTAVIGKDVCRNPYYQAPLILAGRRADGIDPVYVDWMISQLRLSRAVEREREERVRTETAREEAERARAQIEALYLEAQQVTAALAQHTEVLDAVDRVSRVALAELDTPRTMQVIVDAAAGAVGAQHGALFYLVPAEDGAEGVRVLWATSGEGKPAFAVPAPSDMEFFRAGFLDETVLRSDDLTLDLRFGEHGRHEPLVLGTPALRAYLAAPVLARTGEVVGGLFFGAEQPGVFGERDERVLEGIAAQAGLAINNALLFETAQHAVEVRDQFLSIAAHELKTPLTVVKGYAMLLGRQLARGGLNLEQLPTTIEQLQSYSDRLETLVNNLLDTSRIQQGRLELWPEPTDLSALAATALERFKEHPDRRPEHVLTLDAPAPVVGEWDLGRVDQVLTTLIGNAVKYSPEGGHVAVAVHATVDEAVLIVSDEGIGIPEDERAHVFQAFRGLHRTSRVVPGSGLGLYIGAEIVSRHGGTIEVESTPDAGSVFTVRLPLRAPGDPVEDEPIEAPLASSDSRPQPGASDMRANAVA